MFIQLADREDLLAARFVKDAFCGQEISPGCYQVRGGGMRTITVLSLPASRMPRVRRHGKYTSVRKRYSIQKGYRIKADPPFELDVDTEVVLLLNQAVLTELYREAGHITAQLRRLSGLSLDKCYRGRAGEIVFSHLAGSGRVITAPSQSIGQLMVNQVYDRLTRFNSPVVAYGTTDAANVFELLQTLKAADYLGLPAVFDSYTYAHSVGDYWQRVMTPSLKVLGVTDDPRQLGFQAHAKFNQVVDPRLVQIAFSTWGLSHVIDVAVSLANNASFAQWYRGALSYLAHEVQRYLGLSIPVQVIATEQTLKYAPFWEWDLPTYAQALELRAKHSVVAVNRMDGSWRTDQRQLMPQVPVEQIHDQGWWIGGAGIYWAQYSLGRFGGVVFTVKDSSAGQVHLLAREYLDDPSSGLYLLPVGLFRMPTQGQPMDWSIDPWVLLDLFGRWGERRTTQIVKDIWEAIVVPLLPDRIGEKTVVTVGLDGVDFTVYSGE